MDPLGRFKIMRDVEMGEIKPLLGDEQPAGDTSEPECLQQNGIAVQERIQVT